MISKTKLLGFISQNEEEYSMLLAIPCGRDHIDIMTQTKALQSGFIQYLASKQAAGIVNVAEPGSTNPQVKREFSMKP